MNKMTSMGIAVVVAVTARLASAEIPNPAVPADARQTSPAVTRNENRPASAVAGLAIASGKHNVAADTELAGRIRRIVVADRYLSSYAARIVIVSTDGNVHLTGLVQNDGERAQIDSKAAALVGRQHVIDDLRIMSNAPDGAGLRAVLEGASAPQTSISRAVIAAAR